MLKKHFNTPFPQTSASVNRIPVQFNSQQKRHSKKNLQSQGAGCFSFSLKTSYDPEVLCSIWLADH
jgi:hypothetical protein